MMSFAGLGDAPGGGEVAGGDDSPVGDVLGVVLTAGIDGLAEGEFEVCRLVAWVQPANIKISPTTSAAGAPPPLIPRP